MGTSMGTPMGTSLLMALLGPRPRTIGEDEDSKLDSEVKTWMEKEKPELRRALMLEALYAALPYALTDKDAASAVGKLLAKAVGNTAEAPLTNEEIRALRKELREELRKRFDKIKNL